MRSIDDIIDRLHETSCHDESQSPAGSQRSTQHQQQQPAGGADGEDEAQVCAVQVEGPRRHVSRAEIEAATPVDGGARDGGGRAAVSTGESAAGAEPLWTLLGTPLSLLCRRLLVDSAAAKSHHHEQRSSESTEARHAADSTATARVSSPVVQPRTTSVDVPPSTSSSTVRSSAGAPASDDQRPLIPDENPQQQQQQRAVVASGAVMPTEKTNPGRVRSNGGHKPPIPAKPSLPPKPPIAKKPSFGKETGVVRQASSVSSPAAVASAQRQRATSSERNNCVTETTSASAPTSPVIQRDENHNHQHQHHPYHHPHQQQQQQQAAVAARSAAVTRGEDRATHHATQKSKPAAATAGDVAADRRSVTVTDCC